MKLGRKILAASMLAAGPFWLAGSVAAAPIGMGVALKDAAGSNVETVRAVGVGRVGDPGRIGAVGTGGHVDAGRLAAAGWGGGPRGWRAGSGFATGAIVGGAIAAGQSGYGYGGYGLDYGPEYYGYGQAYPTGPYDGYGYGYGAGPGSDYWQSCSYVGGPKTGSWACR
jgi:hypothetical protein